MNLLDLKYAIEVERCGSITQAARKLFIAQPNLSKAIKNLEEEFGILIFERTTKGVVTTSEGQRFLHKARKVLKEAQTLKEEMGNGEPEMSRMKISIPRASYITYAFTRYISSIPVNRLGTIRYEECSATRAISNILTLKYGLGIIRYEQKYEEYFQSILKLKGMSSETILEFDYQLLVSRESTLAACEEITEDMLQSYVEIVHGDIRLPSEEYLDMHSGEAEVCEKGQRIYVYERGSQFDLLTSVSQTYMWVSPMPEELLRRYGLVQKTCAFTPKKMKDLLIWKAGHKRTRSENQFIETLKWTMAEVVSQPQSARFANKLGKQ